MTVVLDALRLTVARLEQRRAQIHTKADTSRGPTGIIFSKVNPSKAKAGETGLFQSQGSRAWSSLRTAQARTSSPGTEPNSTAHVVRATVSAAEPEAVLRFGVTAIDAHLPAGGLNRAALHEVAGIGPDTEHGATPALLVATLLARYPGRVLWAIERRDLFAPALAAVGLHPDRIVFVEAGRGVLAVMEEGLRHPGLAAVVGELSGPFGLTASRRLQLGAEAGVPAFVLRHSRRFDDPLLSAPSAAATRWRVASLHTRPVRAHASGLPGMGRARWRLDLVRCRGGVPSSWVLEASDAQNRLGLAAEFCHGPAAAPDGKIEGGRSLQDLDHTGETGRNRTGRSRATAGAVAA